MKKVLLAIPLLLSSFFLNLAWANTPSPIFVVENKIKEGSDGKSLEMKIVLVTPSPFETHVKAVSPENWGRCSLHFRGSYLLSRNAPETASDWEGILRLQEGMLFFRGDPQAGYLSDFDVKVSSSEEKYLVDYKMIRNYSAHLLFFGFSGKMTQNEGSLLIEKVNDFTTRLTMTKTIQLDLTSRDLWVLFKFKFLLPVALKYMTSDLLNCRL